MKNLTKRQKQVLILVGKGLSNQEIAKVLSITNHTVKAHLSILYELANCSSRVELIVKALRANLITLDDLAPNT